MSDDYEPKIVQPDADVIEGEDEVPRQPSPPLDPFTPVPHPPRGENESRAWSLMRLSIIPIAIVIAIILYAVIR